MTQLTKASDTLLVTSVARYAQAIRTSLARIDELVKNAEAFRRKDFLDDMRGAANALDNAAARATQLAITKTRGA